MSARSRRPFATITFVSLSCLCSLGRGEVTHPQRPDTETAHPETSSPHGGAVSVEGELKQWHKITFSISGPHARERDVRPNPFTDYRLTIRVTHESGSPSYDLPGYFAADGQAAETGATEGNIWRAHFAPNRLGGWTYQVRMVTGRDVAIDADAPYQEVTPINAQTGSFQVLASDKQRPDFRARGRLEYIGEHYLRFAQTGEYFLKAGPDAPETLLAYRDFDNTHAGKPDVAPLKSWTSHLRDWREGDPTWRGGRGKGLIGALNYLSHKGVNTFSFLPYNAGGDGDNVWPFVARDSKLHYDCSKLDQWAIVFDHATSMGLHLHFKLQETEIDDHRAGPDHGAQEIAEALDGGRLGPERKLYCRELIARFAHALALNWNLGEENTQSTEEIRQMAQYLRDIDPYDHPIVIHTYPNQQEEVYQPLLGDQSVLTGASLQNSWSQAHQRTLRWRDASAAVGRPWVVANDEQNPASMGVPPDPGYAGHDGIAEQNGREYTLHDIRRFCLWGTLMAGGAGVEYYFGYQLPQNDLACEDFRSRDRSWDYCRIAINAFPNLQIPFWKMSNADERVGNPEHDNTRYCLAQADEIFVVYLPTGGSADLDVGEATGEFSVTWFNPREGGPEQAGSVQQVRGNRWQSLGQPPTDPQQDWLVIVRRN